MTKFDDLEFMPYQNDRVLKTMRPDIFDTDITLPEGLVAALFEYDELRQISNSYEEADEIYHDSAKRGNYGLTRAAAKLSDGLGKTTHRSILLLIARHARDTSYCYKKIMDFSDLPGLFYNDADPRLTASVLRGAWQKGRYP